jgi:hypothetical protein
LGNKENIISTLFSGYKMLQESKLIAVFGASGAQGMSYQNQTTRNWRINNENLFVSFF